MNDEARPPAIDPSPLKHLSVLYVEDESEVRDLLTRFLSRWVGTVLTAANGQEGVRLFRERRPDLVVTDIKMPVMDGLEMAAAIRSTGKDVPIIVITAHSEHDYFLRAIEAGIDRYVTKPVNTDLLLDALNKSARSLAQKQELEQAKQALIGALSQTVGVLSKAIELRDPYTNGHQKRVSQLAVAIAEEMGMSTDEVNGIRLGSLIHDVGKIRIPAEILNLPRKLTELEFDFVRNHPQSGQDILAEATFPWPVARMIMEHHERMDGSGYPNRLAGEDICLAARIIGVADVVEAMASHRPYRPAMAMEEVVAEIRNNSGKLYDKRVADCCLAVLERKAYKFWD